MKKLAMLFSALALIAVLAFLGFNSNMLRAAGATQCEDDCIEFLEGACIPCWWKDCHTVYTGETQCCECQLNGYGVTCPD